MTDTFAFNAPPVSTHFAPLSNPLSHAAHPPYPAAGTAGYYPGSHPSSAPQGPAMSQNGAGGVAVSSSHHAGALVAVRGDGLEDEGRGEGVHNVVYGFRKEADGAGEAAGGISPGASAAPFGTNAFAHFPHYSNNSFKGNNNVRNTRPMTAPSSVSAPYFQGGLYSNPPHASTSSFYPVGMNNGLYSGGFNYHAPPPESLHGAMPPSTSEVEAYRARGFSLPELAGLPGDGRYAGGSAQRTMSVGGGGGSSGTFMYGPPPLATHDEHGRDGSSGEDSDPYSRPTTGDSRPNSAGNKRTRFGQGTSHRDPPGPNDPLRRYPYNGTSPGANGVDGGPTGSSFDSNPSKPYNFLSSQPEPVSKRPRRRFDEIERLYTCDYPGCQKAYGTLNHLNSHKTMQKHGPKSTPAQFKELRKAWRDSKKAAATELAARARPVVPPPAPTYAHAQFGSRPGDRPRPSTSAGEYHYSVPAPFPGSSIPPHYPQQPQLHLPTAQFMYDAPPAQHASSWGSGYPGQTLFDHHAQHQHHHQLHPSDLPGSYGQPQPPSPQPHRPLTAPTYYSHVPQFGQGGSYTPAGQRHAPGGRRMSLPDGEGRGPATAMFGYKPAADEGGFGSILEEAPTSYAPGTGAGRGREGSEEAED